VTKIFLTAHIFCHYLIKYTARNCKICNHQNTIL